MRAVPVSDPAPTSARRPEVQVSLVIDGALDVARSIPTLGTATDPTWRGRGDVVAFAGRTPDGPVSCRVSATPAGSETDVVVQCWGPGSGWMATRAEALVGAEDDPRPLCFGHDRLDRTNRRHPGVRHGATGLVVDTTLGRILGQRVLASEAGRSWVRLCRTLGGPAPGPLDLLLPPDHERVAESPTWWFHQHGIDRGRAMTLVGVARRADRLAETVELPYAEAYGRLRAVPGLGPWTVNGVARAALGDPDAVIVGDYWITHGVCDFFTGRARGTDAEMLELLERWRGQRGRVERLIGLSGHRPRRFGAGRPTPDITRL